MNIEGIQICKTEKNVSGHHRFSVAYNLTPVLQERQIMLLCLQTRAGGFRWLTPLI